MSDPISIVRGAMQADADALRMIGQNIANADVTAYRRQIPIVTTRFGEALDAASITRDQPILSSTVAIDRQRGTLKATGESLDLAIEGEGFFVLQSSTGTLLTRRGDFHVSGEGTLSAFSGDPVLGGSGPIHVGHGTIQVDADGTVRVDGEIIDRLKVLLPVAEDQLTYLGNGLYADAAVGSAYVEEYAAIRQGHLETSNVSAVNETVQMMETLRHFEAAQRLVRGYDQMLEKAISELGKVG